MSKNTYKQCPSCEAKAKEIVDEEHELDEFIEDMEDLLNECYASPQASGYVPRNTRAIHALLKYIKERI